jgi:hypothetical protein
MSQYPRTPPAPHHPIFYDSDERNLLENRVDKRRVGVLDVNRYLERRCTAQDEEVAELDIEATRLLDPYKGRAYDDDIYGEEEDGIYQEAFPLYSPLLLRGELSLPAIAKLVSTDQRFSRVSQRILREVKLLSDKMTLYSTPGASSDYLKRLQLAYGRLFHHNFDSTYAYGGDERLCFNMVTDPLDYSRWSLLFHKYNQDSLLKPFDRSLLMNGDGDSLLQNMNPEFLLKIFILQIVLKDHPFMNGEERAYAELKEVFTQYSSMFQQKQLEYLANRVAYFAEELSNLINIRREMTEEEAVQLQNCCRDIALLVPMMADASQRVHRLSQEVYTLWKDVKERRRQQTFTTTSAFVKARRVHSLFVVPSSTTMPSGTGQQQHFESGEDAPGSSWRHFQDMLRKLKINFAAGMILLRKVQAQYLAEHRQQQEIASKLRASSLLGATSGITVPANASFVSVLTEEESQKTLKLVEEAVTKLTEADGLFPDLILQLSDNGILTSDTLIPEEEVQRRQILRRLQYYAVVKVNGQEVMRTADLRLQFASSFILDIRRYYELQLIRIPSSLEIDIFGRWPNYWESFWHGGDYHIASVSIPLPKRQLPAHLQGGGQVTSGGFNPLHAQYTHNFAPQYCNVFFMSSVLPEVNPLTTCCWQCAGPNTSACGCYSNGIGSVISTGTRPRLMIGATGRSIAGHIYVTVDFDPLRPADRQVLLRANASVLSTGDALNDGASGNSNIPGQGLSHQPSQAQLSLTRANTIKLGLDQSNRRMITDGSSSTSAPTGGAEGNNTTGNRDQAENINGRVTTTFAVDGSQAHTLATMSDSNALATTNTYNGSSITCQQQSSHLQPQQSHHQGFYLQKNFDFTRENDFQIMLPLIQEIDVNDPINDHLLYVKAKRALGGQDNSFHMYGMDYSVPFDSSDSNGKETRYSLVNYAKVKASMRIRLLMIRAKKPYLFSWPMPLLDKLVKSNELFKTILLKEEPPVVRREPTDGYDVHEEFDPSERSLAGKECVNVGKVMNFLARIRNSQIALTRKMQKKRLTTSSVVIETDYFPTIWAGVQYVEDMLFRRRRVLKPKPKERLPETMEVERCDVLVQIVGARNIPQRNPERMLGLRIEGGSQTLSPPQQQRMMTRGGALDENQPLLENNNTNDADNNTGDNNNVNFNGPGSPDRRTNSASFSPNRNELLRRSLLGSSIEMVNRNAFANGNANMTVPDTKQWIDVQKLQELRRVRSFVEVRFQEHLLATTTIDGTMPLWKQSISIPFLPPQQDFSPVALEQVRDEVYFTLFDEIIEDDAERGGFLEGEDTSRVEKYYLGSFSIPFATIYREGRIEGLFRVDTPMVNMGYDRPKPKALQIAQLPTSNTNNPQLAATNPASNMNVINVENVCASLYYCLAFCCVFFVDCFPCFAPLVDYISRVCSGLIDPLVKSRAIKDVFDYHGQSFPPKTEIELCGYLSNDHTTYMKVMMTLDPLLPVANNATEDFSAGSVVPEDRYWAIYGQQWLEALRQVNPSTEKRPYQLFATNSGGMQVLISRYLFPQTPPQGFEHSHRACLHLVSLVPFMKDAQSFVGSMDLWCSAREFWEIGAGDEEEHAVMLYNYLRFRLTHPQGATTSGNASPTSAAGNSTHNNGSIVAAVARNLTRYPTTAEIAEENIFLVLGNAIPEGRTVYILLRDRHRHHVQSPSAASTSSFFPSTMTASLARPADSNAVPTHSPMYYAAEQFLVINPCTGHVFSAADVNCPLKEIYMLVTPYNLWANIQTTTRPSQLRYNVLRGSDWRPFFGTRCRFPAGGLSSFQSAVRYVPTEISYARQIEDTVYQGIRNGFRRWRSKRMRATTTFHPQAGTAIQELLEDFESWKRNPPLVLSNAQVINSNNYAQNLLEGDATDLDRIEDAIQRKIRTIVSSRQRLRGFPVNIAFTDVDEIVTKIKTLCVHESHHPAVQFVLAVRAVPLFNNLVSLWIFVGCLEVHNPSAT